MKKLVLFFALITIMVVGVSAQSRMSRFEYTQRVRSQTFRASPGNDTVKVAARMSRFEYNQRTRSQIVRMSEDFEADTVKLFPGLLINNKIGRGEKATFVIKNRFVNDVPYCYIIDPQEDCEVLLSAGEYTVEIRCGSYYGAHVFHVDPRRIYSVDNEEGEKKVYFIIEKYLSNF